MTDHSNSNGHVVRQRSSKHTGRNHSVADNNDHDAADGDVADQLHELENEMETFVHRMRDGLHRLAAGAECRRDLPKQDESSETTTIERISTAEAAILQDLSCRDDDAKSSSTPNKKEADRLAPPRKTFAFRNSLLTDMMQISHFRTLYNISCAIFLLLFLTTFVYESVDHGGIKLDMTLLWWAFGKFPIALLAWCCIQVSSMVLLFVPFCMWASHRKGGSKRAGLLDYAMALYYVVYQFAAVLLPLRVIIDNDLPPATGLFLAAEQIRMLMKVHAFVREKAVDVIGNPTGRQELDFSRFLYFLFAPTLIYRDDYPQTQSTNWRLVAVHLWHLGLCIFFLYYVFVRFGVPVFRDFKSELLTLNGLVLSSFHSMFPGVMIMFIVFFGLLHSWMNAFAEALRFGDRQFYREWWNSTSFAQFYRDWNVIVHDWLHQYIYRDLVLLFMLCSREGRAGRTVRNAALVTVFLVSAIWHEYFVTIVLHCVFPVMFVKFVGVGILLYFIAPLIEIKRDGGEKVHAKTSPAAGQNHQPSTVQGIVFWLLLFQGYGWLMCLFSTEYYARINCGSMFSDPKDAWKDYYTPRMWACIKK